MAYKMILAVNFTDERLKQLKLLGMLTKAKIKAVTEEEKSQTVGTILGLSQEDIEEIQALRKDEKSGDVSHEEQEGAEAAPVTMEAIVLCGFASSSVNQLLNAVRRGPLKNIPLKAMVTPNNIAWTIERVLQELSKEHEYFANRKKGEGPKE